MPSVDRGAAFTRLMWAWSDLKRRQFFNGESEDALDRRSFLARWVLQADHSVASPSDEGRFEDRCERAKQFYRFSSQFGQQSITATIPSRYPFNDVWKDPNTGIPVNLALNGVDAERLPGAPADYLPTQGGAERVAHAAAFSFVPYSPPRNVPPHESFASQAGEVPAGYFAGGGDDDRSAERVSDEAESEKTASDEEVLLAQPPRHRKRPRPRPPNAGDSHGHI